MKLAILLTAALLAGCTTTEKLTAKYLPIVKECVPSELVSKVSMCLIQKLVTEPAK